MGTRSTFPGLIQFVKTRSIFLLRSWHRICKAEQRSQSNLPLHRKDGIQKTEPQNRSNRGDIREENPAAAQVPAGERSQDKDTPDPSHPPVSAAACPNTSERHVKHYNNSVVTDVIQALGQKANPHRRNEIIKQAKLLKQHQINKTLMLAPRFLWGLPSKQNDFKMHTKAAEKLLHLFQHRTA